MENDNVKMKIPLWLKLGLTFSGVEALMLFVAHFFGDDFSWSFIFSLFILPILNFPALWIYRKLGFGFFEFGIPRNTFAFTIIGLIVFFLFGSLFGLILQLKKKGSLK